MSKKFKTAAQKARINRRAKKRFYRQRIEGGYLVDGVGTLVPKLRELGYSKYSEYLSSTHWKSLRGKLMPEGTLCGACEITEATNLHHLTYARFGTELDEDLLPLCRDCHRRVHVSERMGNGGLAGALRRIRKHNRKRAKKLKKLGLSAVPII